MNNRSIRDPSIHITKSQFEEILNTLEVDNFPTEAFFIIARKMAINHRVVSVTNKGSSKKIKNILLASKGDASLVSDILYATRIKLKHRGVRKINESNSREWSNCKKLAEICNIFCEDFGLESREGFIKYIELGIKRMGDTKNITQRLIAMQDNITNQYSAELELKEYNLIYTKEIHDYFIGIVARNTGIYESYEKDLEKYIHFAKLGDFLKKKKWGYKTFIDAQFDALAWCNGLPEISQLYTDKAIERFNKYLFKNRDKVLLEEEEDSQINGSLWDKINK